MLHQITGTPVYMSPDLLVNEGGSSCLLPADMWAFGCTVLELVAGKRPWHECGFTHPPPLMLHIVRSQDVPQFPEGISPCLRDFLERCLARDPAQRMSIEQALKHPFLTGASFTPGQVDLGVAHTSARATQLRAHVQGISARDVARRVSVTGAVMSPGGWSDSFASFGSDGDTAQVVLQYAAANPKAARRGSAPQLRSLSSDVNSSGAELSTGSVYSAAPGAAAVNAYVKKLQQSRRSGRAL